MKRTAAILSLWAVHALTGVGTWWLPRSQVSCMEWDRSNSNEHKVSHHYTIGTWNLGMTSILCSGMVRLNILQLGLYFTFISGITVTAVKAEGQNLDIGFVKNGIRRSIFVSARVQILNVLLLSTFLNAFKLSYLRIYQLLSVEQENVFFTKNRKKLQYPHFLSFSTL